MRIQSRIYFFVLSLFLFTSCRSLQVQKNIIAQLKATEVTQNNHLGLIVYDINQEKTLLKYKENTLFLPASNMKILTLYAALENLSDSLVMFQYSKTNTSLCIKGQANPTLLHPSFDNTKVVSFLKNSNSITFDSSNFFGEPYANGWAWEDYADSYQVEISPMPVFGNVVWMNSRTNSKRVIPTYFENKTVANTQSNVNRKRFENTFYNTSQKETQVPFITSISTNTAILGKEIGLKIDLGSCGNSEKLKTFYSTKADTVYRKMMFESDNMIAEHLLLQASQKYTDSMSTGLAIQKIRQNLLPNTSMRWVDGAGLSRYNLISPATLVLVLDKMQNKRGFESVITLLPQVGQSGTMKSSSKSILPIYAKSGSMGGVYNISGYVITKKGKKLAFSFMSNNSLQALRNTRLEMIGILEKIIETY